VKMPAGSIEVRSELVVPHTARRLAWFEGGFLDGAPAITEHGYGDGKAYYIATRLDALAMADLLKRICDEAGVTPVAETPAGVEAVRRGPYLFLLDHAAGEVVVRKEVEV
jgi:beta-galactosidase